MDRIPSGPDIFTYGAFRRQFQHFLQLLSVVFEKPDAVVQVTLILFRQIAAGKLVQLVQKKLLNVFQSVLSLPRNVVVLLNCLFVLQELYHIPDCRVKTSVLFHAQHPFAALRPESRDHLQRIIRLRRQRNEGCPVAVLFPRFLKVGDLNLHRPHRAVKKLIGAAL